jgi:hypothetical protein
MSPLFFFGSGASNAPKVESLTKAVRVTENKRYTLDGSEVWRRIDTCFEYAGADKQLEMAAKSLTRCIYDYLTWQNGSNFTYEDVAHLFFELKKPLPKTCQFADFNDVAYAAHNRLSAIVRDELETTPDGKSRLGSFPAFINQVIAATGHPIRIVTLNHDTRIEEAMVECGIPNPNLGFIVNDSSPTGISIFSQDRLAEASHAKILKLHGSVDWFWQYRPECQYARMSQQALDGAEGVWENALFLSGTENKPIQYKYLLYPALFEEFEKQLEQARRIVVVGYGFGDGGVNERFERWLEAQPEHRMLIVDPNPAGLREKLTAMHQDQTLRRLEFIPLSFDDLVSSGKEMERVRRFAEGR